MLISVCKKAVFRYARVRERVVVYSGKERALMLPVRGAAECISGGVASN